MRDSSLFHEQEISYLRIEDTRIIIVDMPMERKWSYENQNDLKKKWQEKRDKLFYVLLFVSLGDCEGNI